ncbi:hypothetical protein EDD86DRAFT_230030 [Gorgonomyces haynaldii]|nr:hypothetical protein EDD86DRAFT_230030 [Gorgonomyces haynaldii]
MIFIATGIVTAAIIGSNSGILGSFPDSPIIQNFGAGVNGECGGSFGKCNAGQCCSQWGWCGAYTASATDAYCGTGCQAAYGTKATTVSTTSKATTTVPPTTTKATTSAAPSSTGGSCPLVAAIVTTGQCGPGIGACQAGQCCSQYGWCDTAAAYCGTGCQVGYGFTVSSSVSTSKASTVTSSASSSASKTSSATPTSTAGTCPLIAAVVTTGQCGPGIGACQAGQCCSQYGWCDTAAAYCGTGCQVGYGLCDSCKSATITLTATATSSSASATSTATIGASLPATMPPIVAGKVPNTFTKCLNPKHWALTFDDGPSTNVPALVTALNSLGVKATFFVNGQNYADLNTAEGRNSLLAAYNGGHQIASHTYAHADMATLSDADRYLQLYNLDKLLVGIIGKSPRHFRYPYLSNNAASNAAVGSWGFDVIGINVDTKDYDHNAAGVTEATQLSQNEAQWRSDYSSVGGGAVISLDHDFTTHIVAWVNKFVPEIKALGYTLVTVEQCVGTPAYR